MTSTLLKVEDLEVSFPSGNGLLRKRGPEVKAVDGISFELQRRETVGVVGESGCGKTTAARAACFLYKPTRGAVYFDGVELGSLSRGALRRTRAHMQMVFQDPFSSLDPRMTAEEIIAEPLRVHNVVRRGQDLRNRVGRLLELVGLTSSASARYPHEFSGGQRQRIGIARALALNPDLMICDEPVSALDVSIQAQIVNLLIELRQELSLTYLFISHDLSVVRHISDRVMVMYLGKLVEVADTDRLFDRPLHPYTQALLSAVPLSDPEQEAQRTRTILQGDLPSPTDIPSGCRFRTRCPYARDLCARSRPELEQVDSGHWVACHYSQEIEDVQLRDVDPRAGKQRSPVNASAQAEQDRH